MGSYSTSISANPISDIKPTLSDSPTENFINKSVTASNSRITESLYGDVAAQDLNKATSQFGAALNNSTQNITLSGGSSIVDGGAIMGMFNLASKAIEQNSLAGLLQTMQGGGMNTAASAANTVAAANGDVVAKIKEFFKDHKGAVIAGGLLLGFLVYKGVTK